MNDNLQSLRHSLAHLLAAAVIKLYPKAKRTIGPAIDNGFYYDFEFEEPITEKDLPKIEKEMKKLLKTWSTFERREITASEAKEIFKDNPYKLELIEEFSGEGQTLTMYKSSEYFEDLCRGGHAEDMSKIDPESFKLAKVAGAYWRGDEKNKMLTRIYGYAFETKEELEKYLVMLEEAEKRDHKKLGKDLGLFAFSPLVGPGYPLFLPKGTTVFNELQKFVEGEKRALGYSFVHIPHVAKTDLYEKSGHLGKYDAMMPVMTDAEGNTFVMKAMNCPHHFELYNSQPHSYRDLPIRFAETTTVYRNEKSGELSGLVRVKALTQDDTHHFVRHDQIQSEIEMILGLMDKIYTTFNFSDFKVQISIRDSKNKEKYFGGDELWQQSENILIESVKKWGRPYVVEEGEAAFYGPKIDIMVSDSIGRSWQLTTVQLDFNQPENFNMRYIGQDGKESAPAVLHVAILGSIERFMGVIIEHYAGVFPLWLNPVQLIILPISDNQMEYAKSVRDQLLAANENLRIEIDERSESIGKKIREAAMDKVPYQIIIGQKELDSAQIAIRTRAGEDLGAMSVQDFSEKIRQEILEKK